MSRNNRELSQFSAYLGIRDAGSNPGDLSQYDGIITIGATQFTGFPIPPAIGIGTTNPRSRMHIALGSTDVILTGDSATQSGGGIILDGDVVSKSAGYFSDTLAIYKGILGEIDPIGIAVSYGSVKVGKNLIVDHTLSGGIVTTQRININLPDELQSGILISTSTTLRGNGLVLLNNTLVTSGIVSTNNRIIIQPGEVPEADYVSTSPTTGLVTIIGGVGVGGTVNANHFSGLDYLVEPEGRLKLENNSLLDARGAALFNFVDINGNLRVAGVATAEQQLYLIADDDANNFTTGALQVSGGAHFQKQVRVGTGLTVLGSGQFDQGLFVYGPITDINSDYIAIGSSNSTVQVDGEFVSSLIPDISELYDLGTELKKWNNLRVVNSTMDELGVNNSIVLAGNLVVGGAATFTNGINVSGAQGIFDEGIDATLNSRFDNILVTEFGFFNNDITGTATTSKRAIAVDVSIASTDAYYYLTFVTPPTAQQEQTLFVDPDTRVNPVTKDVSFGRDLYVGGTKIESLNGTQGNFSLLNDGVTSLTAFDSALSVSIGNTVGFTTIKSEQVHIEGNFLKLGIGGTSAIRAANGTENITITGNTLTEFAGDIALDGDSITVNNGALNLANANVTNVAAFGDAFEVLIGSPTVGLTSVRNPLFVTGGVIKISGNEIQSSTGEVNIEMTGAELTRFAGDIQVDGSDIKVAGGTTNITMVAGNNTIFAGDIQVTGNDIKASDGEINITMESNTKTSVTGQLRVESNEILDGADHVNITLGTNYVQFTDDIRINGDSIRSSDNLINITLESDIRTILTGSLQLGSNIIEAADGVSSIETVPITGSVGIKSDLTVDNDLYIKGSEFVIRSSNVQIRDRLIDVGLGIDTTSATGLVVPQQDDNKDVGILLNYYDGSSRKAAIFWDDSRNSIGIASAVTESSEVLTVVGYSKLDVKTITINDCAGSSDLTVCDTTTNTRKLANIVIDGGTY